MASDDPEEDWISAFGWLQAGDRLAEDQHWPLALGSYMEAHRKMVQMQVEHPAFEAELVEYRLEKLEEVIAGFEEKLESGDRSLMVKFVDFAESFETGLEQRFDDRFVEALNTLDVAKVLLDEIIFENPDEYRDAVAPQYELLQSSLTYLDGQINFRERERQRASTFVGDGVEWGTTQFVKEEDLPREGDNILLSSELFPGLVQVEGLDTPLVEPEVEVDEESEATDEAGPGIPRPTFRMSSKQKIVADDSTEVVDED